MQHTILKELYDELYRLRKSNLRGIVLKIKFDYTTKCYMDKLKSIKENEMQRIQWDFQIEMDHIIPARWPDLILIYEEKELFTVWILLTQLIRVKIKESERIEKQLELTK